jgi:hypothetical protein
MIDDTPIKTPAMLQADVDELASMSRSAIDDETIAEISRQLHAMRRELYVQMRRFVAETGVTGAQAANETVLRQRPDTMGFAIEAESLIRAIQAGMTLEQYLESDCAASWLRRFGPQRKTHSEGGEA